jgi:hypothetical protein
VPTLWASAPVASALVETLSFLFEDERFRVPVIQQNPVDYIVREQAGTELPT